MPHSTGARRTARYEERMKRLGYTRKHVWVPAGRASELERLAEKMRQAASGLATQSLRAVAARIRRNEEELRAAGIDRLAIFGSLARGEETADSDVDVMIDLTPGRRPSLFDLEGLRARLEEIVGRPVDLVLARALKQPMRDRAGSEAVTVF